MECHEGRCPHRAEGVDCEYDREVEEQFGEFDRDEVEDCRQALTLARRYEYNKRPKGWSIELTRLVDHASIAEDHFDKAREKQRELDRKK